MSALGKLAKEAEILVSRMLTLEKEVKELEEINNRRMRRERKIRRRRQEGGPKVGAGQKTVEIEERSAQDSSGSECEEGAKRSLNTSQRRCKQCNQPGHNSRTCGRT